MIPRSSSAWDAFCWYFFAFSRQGMDLYTSTTTAHCNARTKNKAKPSPSLTLEGGVGFLENGSEVNGSLFSGFLKKSSGAEVRNGSLSLKGSPPNGSGRRIKRQDITSVRKPKHQKAAPTSGKHGQNHQGAGRGRTFFQFVIYQVLNGASEEWGEASTTVEQHFNCCFDWQAIIGVFYVNCFVVRFAAMPKSQRH